MYPFAPQQHRQTQKPTHDNKHLEARLNELFQVGGTHAEALRYDKTLQ